MQVVRRLDSRAALIAGSKRAIKIPMTAMTTNNSTSVNPQNVCAPLLCDRPYVPIRGGCMKSGWDSIFVPFLGERSKPTQEPVVK